MKSIILFRHGKSDWNANYHEDHNRPLSDRGVKAAKKMGKYLHIIQQKPNLVISSIALRAKATAQIAKKYGDWDADLILEKRIYESSVNELINILNEQKSVIDLICLVGHQPTLSSFIFEMTNSSWVKFQTAAMARINFNIENWDELKIGEGKLSWLKKPKEIDLDSHDYYAIR